MCKRYNFMLFLLIVSFITFSQTKDSFYHLRSHFKLELDRKIEIEYTIISKNELFGRNRYFNQIVLLDLSNERKLAYTEKIIYTGYKWQDLLDVPKTQEYTISFIPSNETLKIIYKLGLKDFEIIEYEILNLRTGKKVKISYDQVSNNPSSFIPFVYENFSKEFVSSLEMLRSIVFECWSEDVGFPISPFLFRALWGSTLETEMKPSEKKIEKKQMNKLIEQEVDCDFDAKFGYPCQPEEIPGKNPKVLVIEKKQ